MSAVRMIPCGCLVYVADERFVIGSVKYCTLHEAASDLLAACKSVVEWFESVERQTFESASDDWGDSTLDIPPLDVTAMKAAINKAIGGIPA